MVIALHRHGRHRVRLRTRIRDAARHDSRHHVAIGQRMTVGCIRGRNGVALVAESDRVASIRMLLSVIRPSSRGSSRHRQLLGDLLHFLGGGNLTTLAVGHLNAVVAVGQVADRVRIVAKTCDFVSIDTVGTPRHRVTRGTIRQIHRDEAVRLAITLAVSRCHRHSGLRVHRDGLGGRRRVGTAVGVLVINRHRLASRGAPLQRDRTVNGSTSRHQCGIPVCPSIFRHTRLGLQRQLRVGFGSADTNVVQTYDSRFWYRIDGHRDLRRRGVGTTVDIRVVHLHRLGACCSPFQLDSSRTVAAHNVAAFHSPHVAANTGIGIGGEFHHVACRGTAHTHRRIIWRDCRSGDVIHRDSGVFGRCTSVSILETDRNMFLSGSFPRSINVGLVGSTLAAIQLPHIVLHSRLGMQCLNIGGSGRIDTNLMIIQGRGGHILHLHRILRGGAAAVRIRIGDGNGLSACGTPLGFHSVTRALVCAACADRPSVILLIRVCDQRQRVVRRGSGDTNIATVQGRVGFVVNLDGLLGVGLTTRDSMRRLKGDRLFACGCPNCLNGIAVGRRGSDGTTRTERPSVGVITRCSGSLGKLERVVG